MGEWFDLKEWREPKKAMIYLRPDDLIEFSWPAGSRGQTFKVMGVVDGFRVLLCDADNYRSWRRVPEADYQDLLKRGQK